MTTALTGLGRKESCKFHFNSTGACGQEVMFNVAALFGKTKGAARIAFCLFHVTRPTLKKAEGGAPSVCQYAVANSGLQIKAS